MSDNKKIKKQEASVEESALIVEEELDKVTGGNSDFGNVPRVPFHDYETNANKSIHAK